MPPQVIVRVTSEIDEEVLAGLELYRSLAHPDLAPEVVKDWLYWFEENPFGRPSIAVATLDGETVGMHSFIPARSTLGEVAVPSAKGEFFSVKSDCASAIEPQSGLRFPLALPKLAREHAADNGIRFTFGIPAKAAMLSGQVTGAKPLSWQTLAFVAPTRLSLPKTDQVARSVGVATALVLGRVARTIRRLSDKVSKGKFKVLSTDRFAGDLRVVPSVVNQLFADDTAQLNFRFPDSAYRKYRLLYEGVEKARFVFTAPRRNSTVALKFWSSIPRLDEGLASLLLAVIRDAAQEGANWVRLELPVDHAHRGRELSKMGFVRRQGRAHVALTWCATDALALARDNQPWSLTNAHAGWYQLT